jgi:hypothetical protein
VDLCFLWGRRGIGAPGTGEHLLRRDLKDVGESHEGLVLGVRKAPASGNPPAAVPDLL